jgi:hypothetical protein
MLVKNKKYWFDLDAVRVPSQTGNGASQGLRNKNRFGFTAHPQGIPSTYGQELRNHPLGKNPGDVWTIPTQPFPESHFAVFPEKLIEPMIKAGCPQWICKKCGKARVRITRHPEGYGGKSWHNHKGDSVKGQRIKLKEQGLKRIPYSAITIGWTNCGCNAGWQSGIVLDPFMGSGTTAVVAKKLGRNYIGIEKNPNYVKMAEKRIANTEGVLF